MVDFVEICTNLFRGVKFLRCGTSIERYVNFKMLAPCIIFNKTNEYTHTKKRKEQIAPPYSARTVWERLERFLMAKKPPGLRQYEAGLHGASYYVI